MQIIEKILFQSPAVKRRQTNDCDGCMILPHPLLQLKAVPSVCRFRIRYGSLILSAAVTEHRDRGDQHHTLRTDHAQILTRCLHDLQILLRCGIGKKHGCRNACIDTAFRPAPVIFLHIRGMTLCRKRMQLPEIAADKARRAD